MAAQEPTPAQTQAVNLINGFIGSLTPRYSYHTAPAPGADEALLAFVTEISQPTAEQPVSLTSLRVFFSVPADAICVDNLRYRFEHEELVHTTRASVRWGRMETYFSMLIDYKARSRQTYFLATDFERTRISDPRLRLLDTAAAPVAELAEENAIASPRCAAHDSPPEVADPEATEAENRRLIEAVVELVIALFDPQGFGHLELRLCVQLLESLGANFADGDFRAVFERAAFGRGAVEPFVAVAAFRPLLQEFAVSRVLFLLAAERVAAAEGEYRCRYRFVRQQLRNLDAEQAQQLNEASALTSEEKQASLRDELRSLLDSEVLVKAFGHLLAFMGPASHEELNLEGLRRQIEEAREAAYLREIALNRLTPFEAELWEEVRGRPEVDQQAFTQILAESAQVTVTARQRAFFWAFLAPRDGKAPALAFLKHFCAYFRSVVAYADLFAPALTFAMEDVPRSGRMPGPAELCGAGDAALAALFPLLALPPSLLEDLRREASAPAGNAHADAMTTLEKFLVVQEKLQECLDVFLVLR